MELSKAYNPKDVENRRQQWWEQNGYYKPEAQRHIDPAQKPFTITIPPPNVTGTLHMGHALTLAIEDLMTRYYRMKGARTLYVPGTDHAGIATQSVVEKKLEKEGKKRIEMGRSDFLAQVWDWKKYSHEIITTQCKAMGISADWGREAFTMDEARSRAVNAAFKMLYDKGLIYRDTRMVNWDPVQLTGVSDLEAETDEDGEPGHLWFIRYPVVTNRWDGPLHDWGSGKWAEGATEWITVATTRPETLLGDSAVMVNPDDDRYRAVMGGHAIVPVINREVPIIIDASVDSAFGTGAVKVTPAHDFVDYEVGKRHHLPMIEVMNERAQMNAEAGPYVGLDRFKCRKALVADLEKEGLLVKIEDYRVKLSRGQRSGAVIEPRISLQWWCNMQNMGKAAADSVRKGQLKIVPERFEKTWFQWMDNIRDWCISRQLWWGHQIPVWYVIDEDRRQDTGDGGHETGRFSPSGSRRKSQYCESTEAEAYAAAIKDWGPEVKLTRDADVLDTWFSSGLWPFSTLGWPDVNHPDFKTYYPTTHLETGYDIIFFWVARMVMLGLELTQKLPFDTVYLHGLIRTADGKKMSKSRPEKIIDPLELIDSYGTDAVRFFLITAGAPGNDIKMDARKEAGKWHSDRIEGARNFANKLWNATRFVISKITETHSQPQTPQAQTLADRWILARLNQTIAEARKWSDEYQYGEAGRIIYDFIWNDYCDWYLELSKLHLNADILLHVLETSLRLLHPLMPYVTEELWQALKATDNGRQKTAEAPPRFAAPSLMLVEYPIPSPQQSIPNSVIEEMSALQEVIRAIRNVRAEYNVAPDKRIGAVIAAGNRTRLLNEQRAALGALAKVDEAQLVISTQAAQPAQAVTIAQGDVTIYVPMSGLVDLAAERARLNEERAATEAAIQKSEALLDSDFGKRAPPAVIAKENAKLSELRAKVDQIKQALENLI